MRHWVAISLLAAFVAGCGGGSSGGNPPSPTPQPQSPPAINSFTASPSSVPSGGGSVTLSWDVTAAQTLTIDKGVGTVTGTNVAVQVQANTTFTLSASNAAGTATKSAAVVVASSNAAPQAVITSPADGATFKAGDTITFSGSATDPEDGALPPSRLAWWADLHHATHTHPAVLETAGSTGAYKIPTRGETSDNIWYRFHLRATDSGNQSVEAVRDIFPQKSTFTLATLPSGLQLTLDGQPVTAPVSIRGVVGLERDLGAADQVASGRRYRFTSWSDGGAATHTISTSAANATYTATFTDIGPATNQPPTVTLTAPASATVGNAVTLTATAGDSDGTVTKVEFFEGATKIGEDLTSPYAISWTPATAGARSLTARATDNGGASTTSAAVSVNVTAPPGPDTQKPTATLTAPPNLAANLTGAVALTATASDNVGVAAVEFQIDGISLGEDTAAPYQATIADTAAFASGQHVLRARARDAAGNLSDWSQATVSFGGSVAVPQGFTRDESWLTGLASATAFAQAPDGRFFVSQQGGLLRVVKNATLLTTPFHAFTVDSQGERGLLGVAFHPNFAVNGWVYVYYTTTQNGAHNRISRLVANGDVSTGTETVLVDLPALSSATNHNGGGLHFGVDGKLYVGVGENATSSRAQNLADPFGKMLRFNDDGTIPSDNPFFATQTGLARAVWAYGLRNPFTFAVQPGTGRIHINDVGESTWEEVNLGAAGANYGWPTTEGPTTASGITAPLFAYKHSSDPAGSGNFFVGFAIAGGAFYPATGTFAAPYRGNYFFADYVNGFVARMDLANGNAVYAFGQVSGQPVDMAVSADGALYVLTRAGITRFAAN